MELGELDRAIQDFDVVLNDLKLRHFDAHVERSEAFLRKGDYAQAIRDVEAALDLQRKDTYAMRQRCWIRAALNRDLELALDDCTQSIGHVGFAATYSIRGFVKLRMGRHREAIEDFDAAVNVDENFADAYYLRGIAKLRLGDGAGANADMARARSLKPKVDAEYARYGVSP
jgi:tetratricopeptide (TPR) repeat protein